MASRFIYTPSRFLPLADDFVRERSFTRWMTMDLLQAATDFLKNVGLLAIYAETSPKGLHRYLLWNPPQGAYFEVRSGRTREQFEEFDARNAARGWSLLSLHISENGIHSAVWISETHSGAGTAMLQHFGITPAGRLPAE
jgi:hypothetical protein